MDELCFFFSLEGKIVNEKGKSGLCKRTVCVSMCEKMFLITRAAHLLTQNAVKDLCFFNRNVN